MIHAKAKLSSLSRLPSLERSLFTRYRPRALKRWTTSIHQPLLRTAARYRGHVGVSRSEP